MPTTDQRFSKMAIQTDPITGSVSNLNLNPKLI